MTTIGTPRPPGGVSRSRPMSGARPKYKVFENVRGTRAPRSSISTESGASPSDHVLERGICIGPWTITVLHGSIANATEVDQLSSFLGIPPPEMVFPRNALTLRHEPSGFTYCFDATRALQCVEGIGEDARRKGIDCAVHPALSSTASRPRHSSQGSIKVAYANEWGKSRSV